MTNSRWARRTRPRASVRWSIRGGATAPTRRWCRAARPAARRRRWRRCLCMGATATDTGGSIRQPAAFTATVGIEADLWPLLALGHRRVRILARSGRADRAHRARCRDPAALDGRSRSQGHHVGRSRGAGLRGRDRQIGQGHEDRHSEGISPRRHAGGNRKLWSEGAALAEGRRRRACRRVAAAHQIRAAGLLHRGAGGGLVEPRALRRRALRPARAGPQTSARCTRTRAPRVLAPKCAAAS